MGRPGNRTLIVSLVKKIRESLRNGGKVLVCGNGGSATQAEHFAGELLADGYSCISLTNIAAVTSIANDDNFDNVFGIQVLSLGDPGDVLICLTTSNESENIRYATKCASMRGVDAYTITGGLEPKDPFSTVIPVGEGGTVQYIQERTLEVLHQIWKGL